MVVVNLGRCAHRTESFGNFCASRGPVEKKTVRSGGLDRELAADRLFDFEPFAAIIIS